MNRPDLIARPHWRFIAALTVAIVTAILLLHTLEARVGKELLLEGWKRGLFYGIPLSLWVTFLLWARSIDNMVRKLRQTECLSSSVIEVSTDAIIVIDQQGKIRLYSPAAERLFGYTRQEMIGRNVSLLMPEPDASRHDGYLQNYLNTGKERIIGQGRIVDARHKTGREFPIRLSIGELKSDGDRFFVGVVSDFSERMHAERKIGQFGKAAEANPDLIYITDAHGRIEFVNPAFTRLTGWSSEEILGRTPECIDSPKLEESVRTAMSETLRRGKPWRGRWLISGKPTPEGHPQWLDMTMAPIHNDEGGITGHVALGRDISAIVRREELEAIERESFELRVEIGEILQAQKPLKEKLASALDLLLSMEGMALQRKGGVFLQSEDETHPCLNLFLTQGEFSTDFLEKEHCIPMGACLCGRAALSGALLVSDDCFCDPCHEHKYEGMEAHGHYIIPLTNSRSTLGVLFLYTDPYPSPHPAQLEMLRLVGQMIGLAIANDHLQQSICAARDAAMAATRAKSQFLANMSHEIRTPMNGLLGMLELLRDTTLAEKQYELVETSYNAALSLLDILNDILDYSRIEAGKLGIEQSDFDLWKLVDELAALFSPRANKKGLELLSYTAPDLPRMVKGDPVRLRQVLNILLSNAIKFTPLGEVALTVTGERLKDGRIRLDFEVRDSGIGIAPDLQAKLFQSFVQADSSSTREYGGTGLGLAIAGQLVELMGGRIELESQPGSGSLFRFSISLEESGMENDPVTTTLPDLSGLRVLVVDDNATNRLIVQHYLESASIPAGSAASGIEALAELRQGLATGRPFTTVALDLSMPGMDGLELARQIKADPQLAGLQLLMLSSSPLDQKTASDTGILRTLMKPVRRQALLNALAGLQVQQKKTTEAKPIEPTPGYRGHVLLVEDNVTNQMVAQGLLGRYGLTTDIAENGREALARMAADFYDLVLMDCQMPVMDGYSATRELRRLERSEARPRLPVIAMTANAMPGDRERCLDAGMDDYLAKPLTRERLQEVLKQWLHPVATIAEIMTAPSTSDRCASAVPTETVAAPGAEDTAGVGETQVIDTTALQGLRDVMGPAFAELVQTYLRNSPTLLDDLRQAVQTGDPEAQYQAAHTLKSSSALLGARMVSRLAAELEALGRRAQLATPEQVADLFARFERASKELNRIAAQDQPRGT